MSPLWIAATLACYLILLFIITRRSTAHVAADNDTFFRAGRRSPWWLVAFGMIGASISGVTFISVPGWAMKTGFTYLQMCLGFIVGYIIVALVLIPIYYRLRLTSIYAYLGTRYGIRAHRIGAFFFLLSKLLGATARLYLGCLVLLKVVIAPYLGDTDFGFTLTAIGVMACIWAYTRRGGMQTIVRTDALQTLCLLLAAVGLVIAVGNRLSLSAGGMLRTVYDSPLCYLWQWDASSPQAFWRQVLSGAFIVIVMTGLDQDMMQKNLTCRTAKDAKKDLITYGMAFVPVNAIFLALGVLLYTLCQHTGQPIPANTDDLLPTMVASGALGSWVMLPFTLGIVAAAFSSADSALTALTTTCCVDLLGMEATPTADADKQRQDRRVRRGVHLVMMLACGAGLIVFRTCASDNMLNLIYVMASYTYGPLLGLYAFGIGSKIAVRDRCIPFICLLTPLCCGLLDHYAPIWWNYHFGYELLLVGGGLTMLGLLLCRQPQTAQSPAA